MSAVRSHEWIYQYGAWLVLMVGVMPTVTSFAQDRAELDRRTIASIAQFTNTAWEVRARGFYDVMNLAAEGRLNGRTWMVPSALERLFNGEPERREQVSVALIRLLNDENVVRNSEKNPRSEEYSSYFGDLIAAVAALRDKRALNALCENIATGNLATKGLAALGSDSLERILEILASPDTAGGAATARRMSAVRTLSQMLDPSIVKLDDARSLAKVEKGLIRGAKDKQSWVRISAVEGLARCGCSDGMIVLKALAEHDPYYRPGERGQPAAFYPVREAAKRALASKSPGVR